MFPLKNSDARSSVKGLSAEAKRWQRRLTDEYSLDDEAACLLLQTALEAFDRMRDAQRYIKKDGAVVKDRFGQTRAHPAVVIERDSRAAMLAALKALNLDIEPLADGPGRPAGSFKTGGKRSGD
ncbi:MAG: P27 family phage terminase small subunit [Rhodospirillales bacterium]